MRLDISPHMLPPHASHHCVDNLITAHTGQQIQEATTAYVRTYADSVHGVKAWHIRCCRDIKYVELER